MTYTKYACNERNNWDQIYLQPWSQKALNMLTITNPKRTIYIIYSVFFFRETHQIIIVT